MQAINALDDVVHHRLGRIVNAAQLAQFRIVGLQEGFVEVNDRVATAAMFAKIFHDPRHVRVIERLNQVLDEPGERFVIQRRAGDLLEERAEKRIGAGDEFLRLCAGEPGAAAGSAGAEQAIGECLREHVGELIDGFGLFPGIVLRREFWQQRGGKGIAPVAQLLRSLLGLKRADDEAANDVGELGQAAGKFFGGGDVHRALGEEGEQEAFRPFHFLGGDRGEFAAGLQRREAEGFALLAVHEPAELHVVGEQEIGQRGQITLELFAPFNLS